MTSPSRKHLIRSFKSKEDFSQYWSAVLPAYSKVDFIEIIGTYNGEDVKTYFPVAIMNYRTNVRTVFRIDPTGNDLLWREYNQR